jgi:hypothetical protein
VTIAALLIAFSPTHAQNSPLTVQPSTVRVGVGLNTIKEQRATIDDLKKEISQIEDAREEQK